MQVGFISVDRTDRELVALAASGQPEGVAGPGPATIFGSRWCGARSDRRAVGAAAAFWADSGWSASDGELPSAAGKGRTDSEWEPLQVSAQIDVAVEKWLACGVQVPDCSYEQFEAVRQVFLREELPDARSIRLLIVRFDQELGPSYRPQEDTVELGRAEKRALKRWLQREHPSWRRPGICCLAEQLVVERVRRGPRRGSGSRANQAAEAGSELSSRSHPMRVCTSNCRGARWHAAAHPSARDEARGHRMFRPRKKQSEPVEPPPKFG